MVEVYEGKACRVGDRVRGVYLERYPYAGTVSQVQVLPGPEYHGETWVRVDVDEPSSWTRITSSRPAPPTRRHTSRSVVGTWKKSNEINGFWASAWGRL